MWEKIKNINYRHYIAILLILVSLWISFSCYDLAVGRTIATSADFIDALRYYGQIVAHNPDPAPAQIAGLPSVDISRILPFSVDEILRKLEAFWPAFFSREYFNAYLYLVSDVLTMLSLYLAPAVILIFCVVRLFVAWLVRPSKPKKKKHRKGEKPPKGKEEYIPVPPETPALAFYNRITRKPYLLFCDWMDENIAFIEEYPIYRKLLLTVWLFSFNIFTLGLSLLAFYFYFASSFDVLALLPFLARTIVDLLVMFSAAAWYVWLFIGWVILCKIRDHFGYDHLDHMERCNRGVVRSLPHAVMLEGPMGIGKTTTNTSIVLTKSIDMRDSALDDMLEIQLQYPHFRFAALRENLRHAILVGKINNITPAARWIRNKQADFVYCPDRKHFFGYDFARYKTEHNNDLHISDLWDDLADYAKLFFIYFLQSSLIYANYSIREDFQYSGTGNLPMWNHDLFRRDPRRAPFESAYAHILDMDMLRLGKRFVEDPVRFGVIEFGCIDVTEIEKERRNQNVTKELKRNADECNQLNDGFEDYLKMIRHPSVIRNHVYIFFISDGNRAMDWAAGGREVCTIINIKERSEFKIVLPFFVWACMLYDFFKPRHDAFIAQYENTRDDMCLPVQIYKSICSFFFLRHERVLNRFGYTEAALGLQSGKMDGQEKLVKWYNMRKKDYSDRYSTDCHAGLFEDRVNRATIGVQDYPTFTGIRPTGAQLDLIHSFFITAARQMFRDTKKSA